jgi:hypothetical protein
VTSSRWKLRPEKKKKNKKKKKKKLATTIMVSKGKVELTGLMEAEIARKKINGLYE